MSLPYNQQESAITKSSASNSPSVPPVTLQGVLLKRKLGNTLASTATTSATENLSALGCAFVIIGAFDLVKLPRTPEQLHA